MNEKVFTCSVCNVPKPRGEFHETNAHDRQRQVTSQCKECRSETYFKKRYPNTICAQCRKHRQLDVNGVCAPCNEESALRQCTKCLNLLPSLLSYYQGRRTCKTCSGLRRKSKSAPEPTAVDPEPTE